MRLKDYEPPVTNLGDVIRLQARLGSKTALIFGDQRLSYGEIDELSNRIANGLAAFGIGKGQVVATLMHNSLDHVLAWFACMKLGAVWAPINIALRQLDLLHTLGECRPAAIIADQELLDSYEPIRGDLGIPGLVEVIRGDGDFLKPYTSFSKLLSAPAIDPKTDVHWSDLAGLIFTGGSTGLPKAVAVSNAWYFPGFYRYFELFQPSAEDVHIGVGQLYHTIGSAVEVLSPIFWGMTTVLQRWFNPQDTVELARTHKGSFAMMVGPVMLALLSRTAEDPSFPRFKVVATGSAGVHEDTRKEFRRRFAEETLEIYGQTETGPACVVGQRLWDKPYPSQGKGNGWVEIMIGDRYGAPCPPNVEGEILLRTQYPGAFMSGYYNRPDKYAEACRDLWFHSGDLGTLDENGYLHFVGRIAHALRRRGENVSAIEVEQVIMLHPAVERCAVIGLFDKSSGDDEIAAVVKLADGQSLDPLEVIKFCEERIAYFKVPRYVRYVSQFPISPTKGEIERHKLVEQGVADAFDRESVGYKVRRRA
jgi:crotonobetaine/carnitine-CoA ligase